MKSSFWKTLLAVLLGLFIAWILKMIFWSSILGVMGAAMNSTVPVQDRSVLVMDLSTFTLDEQSQDSFASLDVLQGNVGTTLGILDAVQALYAAAEDKRIACLYLKPDGASAGFAQVEELRAALSYFRSQGKAVVAYTQNPDNAGYYLATVADKLYMTSDHGTNSALVGVAGRLVFLKDLLDRLGVNVQLIRHGKYKSAGEMYIRSESSPENLEQNQEMVSSIWGSLAAVMAESRGLSLEDFNAIVDHLELVLPEDYLAKGLVDELLDKEEMAAKLAVISGAEGPEKLHLIAFPDYVAAAQAPVPSRKDKIAVLFANGEIVDAATGTASAVEGDAFADMIDEIRQDESIKAVVFRVNSPGGSVLASSKIKDAVERLRQSKKVIASYGNYAASGGYWISNSCDEIFSNATTLTGSIGVFSMIPDFSHVASDLLHVNVTSVSSNRHSDMFSLMRPFDQEELDFMQASVEDIYERFVHLVAAGRGLTPEFVDSVAQGRVWTGADALQIGLVSRIGTLQDALSYTMSLLGASTQLSDWNIVQYPAPVSTAERLSSLIGSLPAQPTILSGTPFESLSSAFENTCLRDPSRVYALLPYQIDIK